MKRKLLSTLLTSALIVSTMAVPTLGAPAAGSATQAATGTGTVYSPEDIIDVVVPTSFNIGFNPLGVNIKTSDGTFNGNSQILSGTYAIQNRSTVPVTISAAFTVTGSTAATAAPAADVAKDNEATTKPTAAKFSLDVVTTAKGTTQALAGTIGDKDTANTTKFRNDTDGATLASGVKLSKLSTTPISLTTKAGATSTATIDFMLAAGPYTAKYVEEDGDNGTKIGKVVYQAPATAVFDTVGFKFDGTTSKYSDLWSKLTAAQAPTVKATYTLTESTTIAYNATPFSPTSKAVVVKTGTCDVTATKSTGAANTYTFATAPTFTMVASSAGDGTKVIADTNKVTLLSLVPNAKADTSITVNDFCTYDADTQTITIKTDCIKGSENIVAGFYQVTIGKQSFTMEVK